MEVTSHNVGSTVTFKMHACIGKGGFGEVYKATMILTDGQQHQVAVKTILEDIDPTHDSVRRLRDEARLLAALNHEAILAVHDLVNLNGRVAMVMEYVPGEDLDTAVKNNPMPPGIALQITAAVAGALHAAYTTPSPMNEMPMELVHRDIKPSNIRLGTDGAVKLLDFGIARSSEVDRESKTRTGLIMGTLGYISPERVTEEEISSASDVYGLGCVFYEMLTGRRIYKGVKKRKILGLSLSPEDHDAFIDKRIAVIQGEAHKRLRKLLKWSLAYEPTDRPSAKALMLACNPLIRQYGGPTVAGWAANRDWPPQQATTGELSGQTIGVEVIHTGTLESAPQRLVSPLVDNRSGNHRDYGATTGSLSGGITGGVTGGARRVTGGVTGGMTGSMTGGVTPTMESAPHRTDLSDDSWTEEEGVPLTDDDEVPEDEPGVPLIPHWALFGGLGMGVTALLFFFIALGLLGVRYMSDLDEIRSKRGEIPENVEGIDVKPGLRKKSK